MKEPSVLDYIKSKLFPWRKGADVLSLKDFFDNDLIENGKVLHRQNWEPAVQEPARLPWPWKSLSGFALAIIAQLLLEPPRREVWLGCGLYAIAGFLLLWSVTSGEITLKKPLTHEKKITYDFNRKKFYIGIVLIILALLSFSGNQFNFVNLIIWISATGFILGSFWEPGETTSRQGLSNFLSRALSMLRKGFQVRVSAWALLLFFCTILILFFRFYGLSSVPGEMFSDHAEKLLDVSDVLEGNFSVFFPRNTGREAFQMYLTAFIASTFGTGLTFMSLKLGTALAGFFTLPYIYLLGKEVGNKWVGLLAFFLAGVAYWPNVISRVGLRFPLYPLFAAPILYYLIRGLRRNERNDFLLAGIALGIGLHGYSPIRVMPILVLAAVFIYIIHNHQKENRAKALWGLLLLAFVAFILFLPLFRYMLDQPGFFSYRFLSRVGTSERMYPGPVLLVFLDNVWKGIIMPFWNNGNIWVHSIPGRPALGVVAAATFFAGFIWIIVRYLKYRNWMDLFLMLSIPLLMLPSTLSLAFPDENPSLNRAAGAYIPIFIISAYAIEAMLSKLYTRTGYFSRKAAAVFLGTGLICVSILQNYHLVFNQYNSQFINGAWNTSEIGKVIRFFADTIGEKDQAFVVPYPHWVDTRLVGISAGYPLKDYALWDYEFEESISLPLPKLFIVKPEDQESILKLQEIYPEGLLQSYSSRIEGKDFLLYFIPPGNE